ncbi:Seven_transmembrane protein 1 [Hexamita inflata]|uniref:Seven transmembrane protein 1 n=1 Tax=Hexamita inflata TaxID=28002 RepID=A0AA86PB33_9EUKA|nr:Seven transmembrane protein 1 [Hexamita inflata]CAI9949674.1 Seven transmembrane protein 1 [Hexamita inflata]
MNLKTKQSQGMSTAFLLLWGGADFCNFVAYFLLNGLLTQKLLGTALVLCNIILIVSHLRYKNNTQPRTTNLNYSPFEKVCFVFAILLIVVNITWFYVFNRYKLAHEQNLPKCVDSADPSKVQGIIGQVFGYLAASLFVVANIPQIVKNFRLKSTLNISPGFSLCIACGNLTQTISSVSFSQERLLLNRFRSQFPSPFRASTMRFSSAKQQFTARRKQQTVRGRRERAEKLKRNFKRLKRLKLKLRTPGLSTSQLSRQRVSEINLIYFHFVIHNQQQFWMQTPESLIHKQNTSEIFGY